MCKKVTATEAKKYIDLILSGNSTYLASSILGRERTSLRNAAARCYPRWKEQLPSNHPVNTGAVEQPKRSKSIIQPPKQVKPKVAAISNQKVIEFVSRVDSGESTEKAALALDESKNRLIAAARRYMPEWTMPEY